jgi:hypothetical protein
MHKAKLYTIIAAGVGALASFLPWASVKAFGMSASVSGVDGSDGWINIFLFAPAIVLCLMGNKLQPLAGGHQLGAVIPAGIAGILGLYKIIQVSGTGPTKGKGGEIPEAVGKMMDVGASPGIGLFLIVLAAVAVGVAVYVLPKKLSGPPAVG